MPPDPEILRLEARIDRLETIWLSEVKEINQKLNQITVNAATQHCPSPGLCVHLKSDLQHTTERLNNHGQRIGELEKLRYSLVVIISIITFLITLFGPAIRTLFHL